MSRALVGLALLAACGEGLAPPPESSFDRSLPYALEVVRFTAGEGAGFGQDRLPDVVLGPPRDGSELAGSLDVLSLGRGGEIVLGFGDRAIADGPGVDLVVFENVFLVDGDVGQPFAEPGEVALSDDGETWSAFPCDPRGLAGCAGRSPTRTFDPAAMRSLVAGEVGGDAFDLADLGLARARYVRIRDVGESVEAPTAGFDLDAVGVFALAGVEP